MDNTSLVQSTAENTQIINRVTIFSHNPLARRLPRDNSHHQPRKKLQRPLCLFTQKHEDIPFKLQMHRKNLRLGLVCSRGSSS